MPARAMALVFSFWLLFMIFYTFLSILLLKMGTNLIIASLKGTYWNLGMMLVTIVSAYHLLWEFHPETWRSSTRTGVKWQREE